MRLVLLTGEDYEHCYVTNKLADAYPLVRIIVDKGKPRSGFGRVHYLLRRYTLGQLLNRMVSKTISVVCWDGERRCRAMFRVLGQQNCERHLHEDIITYVHGLNTPLCYETILDLKPDVILVYGTTIVQDKILTLASRLAINMHTGISPYYRGTGCAFWPLYYEELDKVGATIHICTSQIDGGLIYKVGRARLEEDDNLFSVFARCVEVGTELYIQVIRELLEERLQGLPQRLELGREYKAAMKNWWHELTVRLKIRRGLIRHYVARKNGSDTSKSNCKLDEPEHES
jgi:methionyl-tRNA formyltransferase